VSKKSSITQPVEDVVKNSEAGKRRPINPLEDPLTIEEYQKLLVMPTAEDYPHAPARLFKPEDALSALQTQCFRFGLGFSHTYKNQKDKKGLNTNRPDYHPDAAAGKIFVTLGGNKHDGFGTFTAMGVGLGESGKKRAAMAQMLAKLHANGVLKRLFGAQNSPDRVVIYSEDRTKFDTIDMSATTDSTNLDASIDIYNFAASFGDVPVFSSTKMPPSFRKVLLKEGIVRGAASWKVDVKLPALDFIVSAIDKDPVRAETAALLTLKRRLEKHSARLAELRSSMPDWGTLTVDTASDFLTFLKSTCRDMNVELDTPAGKQGTRDNPIEINLNGQIVEPRIIGRTKKDSLAAARLVAAVHVLKTKPELYTEFTKALERGGGKIIRPQHPVKIQLSENTLTIMNDAMREVRNVGRVSERQALPVAEVERAESRPYRTAPTEQVRLALNSTLQERQQAFNEDPTTAAMREIRANLPMSQHSAAVLEMISNNTYSIVVGATGSGKTTQVPQLILDDAIAKGEGGFCDIICTQPRRIAATSVAQRVAEERGQRLQEQIGHHVRFDVKLAPLGGSINFCTSGILLAILRHHPDSLLDSVSHLVLDEVHERDMIMDVLLINLKRAFENRLAAGKSVPKIVLMSATLDTNLFAEYFATKKDGESQPCPSVSVPGRTFPVKERYLSTILEDLQASHNEELESLLRESKKTADYIVAEKLMDKRSTNSADVEGEGPIEWKRRVKLQNSEEDEDGDDNMPRDALEDHVPVGLVAATIARVIETSADGAVLVFLPGLEEIKGTNELLRRRPIFGIDFSDSDKFDVHILHSTVPPADQRRIFDPTPEGRRKIILATNIAETSITVPDVKHVVDAGKLRENRYDATKRITRLECVWESQSNAKQRAGRAGRVSDGNYYALFSKGRKSLMRAAGKPELLRSDLAEVCLSIKAQGFNEPLAQFLGRAIEPPSPSALRSSIKYLKSMQAFTDQEELTVLGQVLAKMPVHPSLGKMILLGIIFRCLDPMLLLGSLEPGRSLFTFPPGTSKKEVLAGHKIYKGDSSDHIALLRGLDKLRLLEARGLGHNSVFEFAMRENLHMGVYREVRKTAAQIDAILQEIKLIPERRGPGLYGGEALNANSTNLELIKSLVLAGSYPNLAVKSFGRVHRTAHEETVIIPMQSANVDTETSPGDLFAFGQLFESGGQMQMRESTLVSPLMVLLFGGKLGMNDFGKIEMDDWLPFAMTSRLGPGLANKSVINMRNALDRVLHQSLLRVLSPDKRDSEEERLRKKFMEHVIRMLESDYKSRTFRNRGPIGDSNEVREDRSIGPSSRRVVHGRP
jgi:HrpA-like RNA helicase